MIFILITIIDDGNEKIDFSSPDAFEKIYNEHKLKIYNFIIFKVNGDSHLAEEILSDTIYSALLSIPKIKDKSKISSWLFKVANNKFNDHLRKKYREKRIIEEKIKDFSETDNRIESDKSQDEKIVILKTAMEMIKPKYREIIKLKFIENKTQKEIADLYKMSRISAESLIFRARDALKKEVKKLSKDFDV